MHSLRAFNDRRKNSRALKAANGPSKAPKGYKPDTASREDVKNRTTMWPTMSEPTSNFDYKSEQGFSEFDNSRGVKGRKTAYSKAALATEHGQGRAYTKAETPGNANFKGEPASKTMGKNDEIEYRRFDESSPVPPKNKQGLTLITGKKVK
jgi:hypothetical protein